MGEKLLPFLRKKNFIHTKTHPPTPPRPVELLRNDPDVIVGWLFLHRLIPLRGIRYLLVASQTTETTRVKNFLLSLGFV